MNASILFLSPNGGKGPGKHISDGAAFAGAKKGIPSFQRDPLRKIYSHFLPLFGLAVVRLIFRGRLRRFRHGFNRFCFGSFRRFGGLILFRHILGG